MKKRLILFGLVVCMCICTGILCKQTLAKSAFQPGMTASECQKMRVTFRKQDIIGYPTRKNTDSWIDTLKENRSKKNIGHIYDDYDNVGVFETMEDFRMYSTVSQGKLKLLKSIKGTEGLQEGHIIDAMLYISYSPKKKGSNIYQSCDAFPVLQKGEVYLFVYNKIPGKKAKKVMESNGAKLPEKYMVEIGNLANDHLPLTNTRNDAIIEPKEQYTLDELAKYDFFSGSKKLLDEWYKTKDAILTHYVGENYWELQG